tara:strand:- start:2632 stop:2988 length:357 start_codon:yes stop_codon:yes gene_type:complete
MYKSSSNNNLYYPAYKFEVRDILQDIRAIKFHLYSRYWSRGSSAEVVILKKCGRHQRNKYNPAPHSCTNELLTNIGTNNLYYSNIAKDMISSAGNSPAVGFLYKGTGWTRFPIVKNTI